MFQEKAEIRRGNLILGSPEMTEKNKRLELTGVAAFHGYEDELVWMKEQVSYP